MAEDVLSSVGDLLQGERKNGSPNELIRFFGQRLLYGQDGHIEGDV